MVTYGVTVNDCLTAVDALAQAGVEADLVKLDQIAPLCLDAVRASLEKSGRLLVVEEAAEAGCVGVAILAELTRQGKPPAAARLLNLKSGLVPHGAVALLRHRTGLDPAGIEQAAKELLAHET